MRLSKIGWISRISNWLKSEIEHTNWKHSELMCLIDSFRILYIKLNSFYRNIFNHVLHQSFMKYDFIVWNNCTGNVLKPQICLNENIITSHNSKNLKILPIRFS